MILLSEEEKYREGGEENADIHNSYERELDISFLSRKRVGGSRHLLTDAYLIISLSSSIIINDDDASNTKKIKHIK
jgi:hypothetical protein